MKQFSVILKEHEIVRMLSYLAVMEGLNFCVSAGGDKDSLIGMNADEYIPGNCNYLTLGPARLKAVKFTLLQIL